jgi:hypothetical protein
VSEEKQDFLRRWSRLKNEASQKNSVVEGNVATESRPVELPPLESLDFESDFKAFMQSKVEESIKRAALKKLFADPRFNVMDGLDTYIDDYTKAEPFTEGLLARIEEVREKLLAPPPAETERGEQEGKPSEGELAAEPAEKNVDSAQDPKAL